jgi:hypothetical protein
VNLEYLFQVSSTIPNVTHRPRFKFHFTPTSCGTDEIHFLSLRQTDLSAWFEKNSFFNKGTSKQVPRILEILTVSPHLLIDTNYKRAKPFVV